MINNNEVQELKKQYPEFFKKHPSELLEFILSEETSSKIAGICLENGIEDEEKIEKIANRVVSALLKEFPKEKLPQVLEKGVGLNLGTAEKISAEINQFIFSHVLTPGFALKLKENPEKSEKKKRE